MATGRRKPEENDDYFAYIIYLWVADYAPGGLGVDGKLGLTSARWSNWPLTLEAVGN